MFDGGFDALHAEVLSRPHAFERGVLLEGLGGQFVGGGTFGVGAGDEVSLEGWVDAMGGVIVDGNGAD